ncbi:tetratricopeptide repeat protein [Roseivivax sediminis]|uniref:Tetratricopeptide repeat-containing protein n=1 Tax=Roseivivax sediminis TaxID=936889 RepID=A0A1I2DEZ7_9RHOB|nr:tetratricopeptide repeat protein [Roseivivax sediminis]SFE78530.1 Tetratricopeptide repeat-containing protein [Roseivivax sediminis]
MQLRSPNRTREIGVAPTRTLCARTAFHAFKLNQNRTLAAVLVGFSALALMGCKSEEARAVEHLQRAATLLQDGEEMRAAIEFRNALDLAPDNVAARLDYANLLLALGDTAKAERELAWISESHPDLRSPQLLLADLEMERSDWQAARKRLETVEKRHGSDDEIALRAVIVEYATGNDDSARLESHKQLLEYPDTLPGLALKHAAISDGHARTGDYAAALAAVEQGLSAEPDNLKLLLGRLQLLYKLDDRAAITEQLQRMVAMHPELRQVLVAWHIETGELDQAEHLLRTSPDIDDVPAQAALLRFLAQYRDPQFALDEIDGLIGKAGNTAALRGLRATLAFETGAEAEAIAQVRALLDEADADDPMSDMRFILARMLDAVGERRAASEQLDILIHASPRHADGLLLRGRWYLEAARAAPAIRHGRTVLSMRPNDPAALALLADAHALAGDEALSTEMRGLAFRTSGHAPEEALSYADHLDRIGQVTAAVDILTASLAHHDKEIGLLDRLGSLYMRRGEEERATDMAQRLRALGSQSAIRSADLIELERIAKSGTVDNALRYLDGHVNTSGDSLFGHVALVRAYLIADRLDLARRTLDVGLRRVPDHPVLLAVHAQLLAAEGDPEGAVNVYMDLIERSDTPGRLWQEVIDIRRRQGDPKKIESAIRAARAAVPDTAEITWEQARHLVETGRPAEAIEVYRRLLETHPDNLPVRNNLASLLAASEEPGALDEAAALAAPLAETDVPQFLDTFGNVSYRLGKLDAATKALSRAAARLPGDFQVQMNAADAHAAAGETEAAGGYYRAAMTVSAEDPDQRARAEQALLALEGREGYAN